MLYCKKKLVKKTDDYENEGHELLNQTNCLIDHFVLLKTIYGQFQYSDVIEEYRRDKEMCYCQDSYDSLFRYSGMILHGRASPVHLEVY